MTRKDDEDEEEHNSLSFLRITFMATMLMSVAGLWFYADFWGEEAGISKREAVWFVISCVFGEHYEIRPK